MIRKKRSMAPSLAFLLAGLLMLSALQVLGQTVPAHAGIIVKSATRHDVSPPLREIPSFIPKNEPMREFDEHEHHVPQAPIRTTIVQDMAVQQASQPLIAA